MDSDQGLSLPEPIQDLVEKRIRTVSNQVDKRCNSMDEFNLVSLGVNWFGTDNMAGIFEPDYTLPVLENPS